MLGGYFSTKRAATSVELDLWVPPSQVLNLCYSILRVRAGSIFKKCTHIITFNLLTFELLLLQLQIFRDHGNRKDRQNARLLWLIEEWGLDAFRQAVLDEMQTNAAYGVGAGQPLPMEKHQHHAGPYTFPPASPLLSARTPPPSPCTHPPTPTHPTTEPPFARRDYLGVHPQKQAGYSWVGLHVPVGRFRAFEIHELGRLADRYSGGELRLTVEQNVIFPNVKDEDVPALLADPFVAGGRFQINPGMCVCGYVCMYVCVCTLSCHWPYLDCVSHITTQRNAPSHQTGPLARGLVACTGAQFCGVGLVETKTRAIDMVEKLEAAYAIPDTVRIHFSGCPNSCGQSQVADIGLMGAPAKKDGKAVEGVDVFLGGAVGEEAALGDKFLKNVAMGDADADVLAALGQILEERFGAVKK